MSRRAEYCGGERNLLYKIRPVRPGPNTEKIFDSLLHACEQYAFLQNAVRLVSGVNTGRHNAYRRMIELGFRTDMQGVAMQRPYELGYNRAEVSWLMTGDKDANRDKQARNNF